jgi:thiamine biosynthesis protein ThiI
MIRAVLLLSGGLDSPVAGHLLIRQGYDPVLLAFVTNGDDPNEVYRAKIRTLARHLATMAGRPLPLVLAPYFSVQDFFIETGGRKFTCLFCKRMMLRVARRIAAEYHASFVATGEILGEQASQTLDNLAVINQAAGGFPVVRPVVGLSKQEVIAIARRVGTYDLSIAKAPECG